MSLKLYFDLMSQPSRACWMFLKANKIPFESHAIALRKLEHKTDEFAKVSPFQFVPVIEDNGFVLTESSAILTYLARKYKTPDHWYPKDFQKRARVDEYLHWHHLNFRLNAAMYFRTLILAPLITGREVDTKKLEMFKKQLNNNLDQFEKYFIGKTPFVSASNVSVADIQALVELMQPVGAAHNVFADRPQLTAWRDRVKETLQPHFDEAHVYILKVAGKRLGKSADN